MLRSRGLYRLAATLVIFVASAVPALAQRSDGVTEGMNSVPLTEEEALARDASSYAADESVSLQEAVRRLQLQEPAGELNAVLTVNERDTFAGAWIQHDPEFRIIVQFTRDAEATIAPYIEGGPLADIVEVRTAAVTLADLEAAQAEAVHAVRDLGLPVEAATIVSENQVDLYVTDLAPIDRAVDSGDLQLPDYVEVVEVESLSVDDAAIYAGLNLSTCTTGFSVKNVFTGVRGITTSGHCSNSQSYLGTSLPMQHQAFGGSFDVQWHTTPGHIPEPSMWDGGGKRNVTAKKHWQNQMQGQFVCKYGKVTGYTCGNIVTTTFQPNDNDHNCGCVYNANFVWVHNSSGVQLSLSGDSGGPWFNGTTAYGITKGHNPAGQYKDAYYMAVNFIETGLPVSVLLN